MQRMYMHLFVSFYMRGDDEGRGGWGGGGAVKLSFCSITVSTGVRLPSREANPIKSLHTCVNSVSVGPVL